MAVETTYTINTPTPNRRWSRPYAITLSDTNADRNLERDGRPYRYIQNVGTSGLVVIVWQSDLTTTSMWWNQGEIIEGGLWVHARTTGTTVGVDLRGLVGLDGKA